MEGKIKRQVFYSFHYEKDVWRAAQIRNIGALDGNEPVSENAWEEVKKKGDKAIKKWIDDNMEYRSCVVVLVGTETAKRPWVQYEIKHAWEKGKGLVGIYIHNIKNEKREICLKGNNPFTSFKFENGKYLSSIVKCYNPSSRDAYNDIRNNIEDWVEEAIEIRNQCKYL